MMSVDKFLEEFGVEYKDCVDKFFCNIELDRKNCIQTDTYRLCASWNLAKLEVYREFAKYLTGHDIRHHSIGGDNGIFDFTDRIWLYRVPIMVKEVEIIC